MEPIYRKQFTLEAIHTDCHGALLPSALLYFVQEAAGEHCGILNVSWEQLNQRQLFWAILRHRIQVTRMPQKGETVTLETWPMPTTRTAYPRSVIAWDARGNELFRTLGLWVLMDSESRSMVLPKKSGVEVMGILRGTELTAPGSLVPGTLERCGRRRVCFTDLDVNGHMNNTRYLDWIWDLLPESFHRGRSLKEMTLCYLAEAREGDCLDLKWTLEAEGRLQVDIFREEHRIFAAKIEY